MLRRLLPRLVARASPNDSTGGLASSLLLNRDSADAPSCAQSGSLASMLQRGMATKVDGKPRSPAGPSTPGSPPPTEQPEDGGGDDNNDREEKQVDIHKDFPFMVGRGCERARDGPLPMYPIRMAVKPGACPALLVNALLACPTTVGLGFRSTPGPHAIHLPASGPLLDDHRADPLLPLQASKTPPALYSFLHYPLLDGVKADPVIPPSYPPTFSSGTAEHRPALDGEGRGG